MREAWVPAAGMYLRLVPIYRVQGLPKELENDFHESVYKAAEQKDMPLFVFFERIDNVGPYSPENCCWATRKIQCRNTRRNHLITFAGETLPLAEWAERAGIGSDTILYRLKAGWSLDRALTASLMC